MKAAINTIYGAPEVVVVADAPNPEAGEGEVLIRVHATTVNRTDCGMRTPYPLFARAFIGLFKPKLHILGLDFAGVVETVGAGVTAFKPGDKVFGLSPNVYGAHAEYICVPANSSITHMPNGVDFAEAAPLEGAWYADMSLQAFNIGPGHKILIYGTSGAIGTAALQLAKAYGASVTAVTSSAHLALAEQLGADRVVDYEQEDFTALDEAYDFALDAVGKQSYFRFRKVLKPKGIFASTDLGSWGEVMWLALWSKITGNRRVIFPMPKASKALIEAMKARIEAGQYRAVIDRRYRLDDIVEAYRYVETGQKVGNVIIDVAP